MDISEFDNEVREREREGKKKRTREALM